MTASLPVIGTASKEFVSQGAFWRGSITASIWPTADRIYYYPFSLRDDFTVVQLWLQQSANGGGGSTARLGVYNASTLARVVQGTSSIDLSTGAAVIKTASCSTTTLTSGTPYFMAITVNVTGAWTGIGFNAIPTLIQQGQMNGVYQEVGAGTLPTTAAPSTLSVATTIYWHCGISSTTSLPV